MRIRSGRLQHSLFVCACIHSFIHTHTHVPTHTCTFIHSFTLLLKSRHLLYARRCAINNRDPAATQQRRLGSSGANTEVGQTSKKQYIYVTDKHVSQLRGKCHDGNKTA